MAAENGQIKYKGGINVLKELCDFKSETGMYRSKCLKKSKPENQRRKKKISPIKKQKKKDRGNFSRYSDKLKSQRQEKRNSEHG